MTEYDPADDARKSYDVCIAAMGERKETRDHLEHIKREMSGLSAEETMAYETIKWLVAKLECALSR